MNGTDSVIPSNGAVEGGPGQSANPAAPPPLPESADIATLRAALVNLSATQGRQAKELRAQALALEAARAKIDALTADLGKLTGLAEKYRPAVEKFINGPGRLLLKV